MNFISDDIKAVVEAMRPIDVSYGQPMLDYLAAKATTDVNKALMPFYMPGHRLEIANRLLEKTDDPIYKYQKYPLIALRMDVPEPFESGGMNYYKLNIVILAFTDKCWNYEQRLENVIKPVLAPLYEKFIQELGNVGLFSWEGDSRKPPHTPILRPFWGTAGGEGNAKYIFADPLDAIEIIDLELYRSKKC